MSVTLRPLAPGDLGWIVAAQTRLYVGEMGWAEGMEATLLRIALDFAEARDPRSAGWIAEGPQGPLGAVLVVPQAPDVAQLRLLHVEKSERGQGVGGRLVDAVLNFAKAQGYARILLETKDVLTPAHALYRARGFALISQRAEAAYGQPMHDQLWARDL